MQGAGCRVQGAGCTSQSLLGAVSPPEAAPPNIAELVAAGCRQALLPTPEAAPEGWGVFIELMTSGRKLKASREGSK